MKITYEMIEDVKTPAGGWKYRVLNLLGVETPPITGWKHRIVGKELSAEAWSQIQDEMHPLEENSIWDI